MQIDYGNIDSYVIFTSESSKRKTKEILNRIAIGVLHLNTNIEPMKINCTLSLNESISCMAFKL